MLLLLEKVHPILDRGRKKGENGKSRCTKIKGAKSEYVIERHFFRRIMFPTTFSKKKEKCSKT